jgi:hypothetical protein
LLVRHLQHWRNPDVLVEPDATALQPLWEGLCSRLDDGLPPAMVLEQVEQFVIERIPYEWDWNTWGTADYLPTVTEVLEMGKEDCDGRAVVAASLLRRLGFEAQLVSDFAHVWVVTDHGATMGPGGRRAITATSDGPRLQLAAIVQVPRALAHGIAVFPWQRELILLFATWLLMLRAPGRTANNVAGLALLLAALMLVRWGGRDYRQPIVWLQWSGLVCAVGGFCTMLLPPGSRRLRRDVP